MTGGAGTAYHSGTPEFNLGFSGDRVSASFVLCVCFVDRYLSFSSFSFDHCVVWPSIYGFWLSLWYLKFTDSDYPFRIFKLFLQPLRLKYLRYSIWSNCMFNCKISDSRYQKKPNKTIRLHLTVSNDVVSRLFIKFYTFNSFQHLTKNGHFKNRI